MMAAKLEWVRDANGWWHAPRSCGAKGGYWSIAVNNDGMFLIAGETEKRWHTLSDAKAYCQAHEDAPPAELPQVGSVWGVPGKPETWRKVITIGDCVRYGCFGHGTYLHEMADWNHWLRESGAVRIDDGGVRALETEVTHWRTATERLEKSSERLAKELATAEGEVARLRAEHEAVQAERNRLREWKAIVSNAIQNIPEFAAGQWGGDKDGWGYHFEVVQYLIRNRDELRTKVGLMEAEAGRGTPLKGAAYVRVGRAAGRAEIRERAETAEKERDDARAECARLRGDALAASTAKQESEAARGRLLEVLRDIAEHNPWMCEHDWANCIRWFRDQVREAIQREEEGVKS